MSAADKEKDKNVKGDLGLLEEDDEFEEFPAEGKSAKQSHIFSKTVCLSLF